MNTPENHNTPEATPEKHTTTETLDKTESSSPGTTASVQADTSGAWIYIFSKFTPEALLLEAAIIFLLFSTYAAYWILKKRRWGVVQTAVPSGVVKDYLSQLLGDASQLRTLLFGLLGGQGNGDLNLRPSLSTGGGASDPLAAARLMELEARIADQSKSLQAAMDDKSRLEKEIIVIKEKGGGGGDNSDLLAKIKELEARLAEYAIIEDDLANLKKLQQENAQLKAQLGGAAPIAVAPAVTAVAATPPSTPTAPPEATTQTETSQPAPTNSSEPSFEQLVNQIEETLQPAAAANPETGATPAEAATPETTPVPTPQAAPEAPAEIPAQSASVAPSVAASLEAQDTPKTEEKLPDTPPSNQSDSDLVAEFEKMLST